MSSFPCVVRFVSGSGQVRYRLGDRLVDRYLEFVAGRSRPNTLRAVAFDLKTFFTVVGKDPVEVTAVDVFEFLAHQLGQYAQTAGWDLSTRESNLWYIRRTISPDLRGGLSVSDRERSFFTGVNGRQWPRTVAWSLPTSSDHCRPARRCRYLIVRFSMATKPGQLAPPAAYHQYGSFRLTVINRVS